MNESTRHASAAFPPRASFWIAAIKRGIITSLVRVCALWFVAYTEWTGKQSLSHLWLIVFLLPEGLLIPKEWPMTTGNVWLFTGVLIIGSVSIVLMMALAYRASVFLWHRLSRM